MSWTDRPWQDHDSVLEAIDGLRPNAEGWVYAICPFCSEARSSKRRLSFNLESGWYRCWNPGCQIDDEKGYIVTNWVSVPGVKKPASEKPQLKLPEEFVCLTDSVSVTVPMIGRKYYNYYVRRQVSDRAIIELELGFCDSGAYNGMVIVPVRIGGRLEGYAGRSIYGKRFKNAKNEDGGHRAILNGDALFAETDLPLYCVEGPFDTLRHYPYAVGFLGKPTHEQIELLQEAKRPLLITLDADAWKESWALACKLRVFCGVDAVPVFLRPGMDPGATSSDEMFKLACDALTSEGLELPPIAGR